MVQKKQMRDGLMQTPGIRNACGAEKKMRGIKEIRLVQKKQMRDGLVQTPGVGNACGAEK